ncbi:MAG TPA: purine-nucleoside phosphorylase [Acidimicrobiia bacterium]|nr:purine-nucleoside phosphorylase [Acidimicrobiia bacterium]
MSYHTIMAAAAVIAARSERDRHDAAVVLGSGLSTYARSLPGAVELPYQGIPGFPTPQVTGHAGSLFSVPIEGRALLVFAGRVHSYEGWDMDDIVFGVRTAVATGARRVLLTNAAGGVNESFSPGDLVVISDHLNLSGRNPLTGPNDDRLGPRFPDMTEVYTKSLRSRLRDILTERGLPAHEGVYAAFPGPTYETPAEVQMAKRLGADLVGMSTVPEAIAVRHMGAEVAGISLVTNLAAGISRTPLSHAEVTETAMRAQTVFADVVDAFLPTLIAD